MKRTFVFVLVVLFSISLYGCGANKAQHKKQVQQNTKPEQTDKYEEATVKNLVKNFGSKLQLVSLQAPKDIVTKSLQENYKGLVSPALLTKWKNDPINTPGRLVSSPWPDRIDIQTTKKLTTNSYEVKGKIIEITSEEKIKGGVAAQRPITLVVKKINNRWLINSVTLGAYENLNAIIYNNNQYGFKFTLPISWKAYKIVTTKWEGLEIGGAEGEKIITTGPIISIRHPKWTTKIPRQDIPIMIFTNSQWNDLKKEKFHIGAAPIGPKELGRNSKYVFALPARYNFAFPAGYEEVEKILEGNPLQTVQIRK